jgi:CMP-N-acetylneuraminic acid synthetase
MFKGKRVLGLIPARGGSKRLPGKNILPFNGKPLIAWTISAGNKSIYIDYLAVSTEDQEIQEIALDFGVDCVISRPAELASDQATSADVTFNALQYLEEKGGTFDYLVLLQPTSPLRRAQHIDEAFHVMSEKKAQAVVSVCRTEHPLEWMNKLPSSLSMDEFLISGYLDRNNCTEYDFSYQINGAVYLITVTTFKESKTFFPEIGSYAYVMDRRDSVDIDTELDFFLAECLHKHRGGFIP